jgi:hypothetical protein
MFFFSQMCPDFKYFGQNIEIFTKKKYMCLELIPIRIGLGCR